MELSARKVGPKVYTRDSAHAAISACVHAWIHDRGCQSPRDVPARHSVCHANAMGRNLKLARDGEADRAIEELTRSWRVSVSTQRADFSSSEAKYACNTSSRTLIPRRRHERRDGELLAGA
jgi:hypothetical protein